MKKVLQLSLLIFAVISVSVIKPMKLGAGASKERQNMTALIQKYNVAKDKVDGVVPQPEYDKFKSDAQATIARLRAFRTEAAAQTAAKSFDEQLQKIDAERQKAKAVKDFKGVIGITKTKIAKDFSDTFTQFIGEDSFDYGTIKNVTFGKYADMMGDLTKNLNALGLDVASPAYKNLKIEIDNVYKTLGQLQLSYFDASIDYVAGHYKNKRDILQGYIKSGAEPKDSLNDQVAPMSVAIIIQKGFMDSPEAYKAVIGSPSSKQMIQGAISKLLDSMLDLLHARGAYIERYINELDEHWSHNHHLANLSWLNDKNQEIPMEKYIEDEVHIISNFGIPVGPQIVPTINKYNQQNENNKRILEEEQQQLQQQLMQQQLLQQQQQQSFGGPGGTTTPFTGTPSAQPISTTMGVSQPQPGAPSAQPISTTTGQPMIAATITPAKLTDAEVIAKADGYIKTAQNEVAKISFVTSENELDTIDRVVREQVRYMGELRTGVPGLQAKINALNNIEKQMNVSIQNQKAILKAAAADALMVATAQQYIKDVNLILGQIPMADSVARVDSQLKAIAEKHNTVQDMQPSPKISAQIGLIQSEMAKKGLAAQAAADKRKKELGQATTTGVTTTGAAAKSAEDVALADANAILSKVNLLLENVKLATTASELKRHADDAIDQGDNTRQITSGIPAVEKVIHSIGEKVSEVESMSAIKQAEIYKAEAQRRLQLAQGASVDYSTASNHALNAEKEAENAKKIVPQTPVEGIVNEIVAIAAQARQEADIKFSQQQQALQIAQSKQITQASKLQDDQKRIEETSKQASALKSEALQILLNMSTPQPINNLQNSLQKIKEKLTLLKQMNFTGISTGSGIIKSVEDAVVGAYEKIANQLLTMATSQFDSISDLSSTTNNELALTAIKKNLAQAQQLEQTTAVQRIVAAISKIEANANEKIRLKTEKEQLGKAAQQSAIDKAAAEKAVVEQEAIALAAQKEAEAALAVADKALSSRDAKRQLDIAKIAADKASKASIAAGTQNANNAALVAAEAVEKIKDKIGFLILNEETSASEFGI